MTPLRATLSSWINLDVLSPTVNTIHLELVLPTKLLNWSLGVQLSSPLRDTVVLTVMETSTVMDPTKLQNFSSKSILITRFLTVESPNGVLIPTVKLALVALLKYQSP